jgi:hypothetical protein
MEDAAVPPLPPTPERGGLTKPLLAANREKGNNKVIRNLFMIIEE